MKTCSTDISRTNFKSTVLVSSIPSILFCGFYELLHNKCSSYVDAHELIWLYIENFKFWCYVNKTLIFLLISMKLIIWNLVKSRNYIYLLKQTLLFYVHVNVNNVYLSLNMLNMSFSKQFYIFVRILLGQSWPYSCTTKIICIGILRILVYFM